jgi:hypothetical protein
VIFPQALNVLMLKILENSNRNFTFSALLALLLDVPPELAAAGGSSADGNMQQQSALAMRWADLVVKCLIKSTKALPQVIQVRLTVICCAAGRQAWASVALSAVFARHVHVCKKLLLCCLWSASCRPSFMTVTAQ